MYPTSLPRITLVTPSFNQGSFLEATIQSVLSQEYQNLEYIIVDGGSTDESVDIIRRYEKQLAWWVSEPDGGQTDAIKKGFARSSGVLMNWLNSDDLLRPGALYAVAQSYIKSQADLLVGRDRQFTDDPENPVGLFSPEGYVYPDCLKFWTGRFRYHQPCTFFSAQILNRSGGLDLNLHYVMDYDLYCRILRQPSSKVVFIDQEISAFRLHHQSKTNTVKAGFISELRMVSKRYWPQDWANQVRGDMDRYSAECSLHQAAEAFKSRKWQQAFGAISRAMSYAPFHSLGFAVNRAFGRNVLRKELPW